MIYDHKGLKVIICNHWLPRQSIFDETCVLHAINNSKIMDQFLIDLKTNNLKLENNIEKLKKELNKPSVLKKNINILSSFVGKKHGLFVNDCLQLLDKYIPHSRFLSTFKKNENKKRVYYIKEIKYLNDEKKKFHINKINLYKDTNNLKNGDHLPHVLLYTDPVFSYVHLIGLFIYKENDQIYVIILDSLRGLFKDHLFTNLILSNILGEKFVLKKHYFSMFNNSGKCLIKDKIFLITSEIIVPLLIIYIIFKICKLKM